MEPDFTGYATRANIKCSDGRTIRENAFAHQDGAKVPLVWNHNHNDVDNVLGHAYLENRKDGVYVRGYFNDQPKSQAAKEMVEHGDITALSIYANRLQQTGGDVLHGDIREVSLVMAGANPGAYIDNVIQHSDDGGEDTIDYTSAVIFGNDNIMVHSDTPPATPPKTKKVPGEKPPLTPKATDSKTPPADDGETVADVFNTLTDKQKNVVYAMIGEALDEANGGESGTTSQSDIDDTTNYEGADTMKHNLFDSATQPAENENVLSHAEQLAIIKDATRYGSLRQSAIEHKAQDAVYEASDNSRALQHGITNIDYLFPDAKNLNPTPGFITKKRDWVDAVMSTVHHTPFSRIKSMFADLTADDARARGYIKGKQKVDEVFSLLKRTTTPTTVYKHQKLDRDDVVDIVDFDVVAWLKSEMRMMLDEEIAIAILIGDGRLSSSDDHINDTCIRPIWTDDDLYTIKKLLTFTANETSDAKAKAFIQMAIRSRKDYQGSGNPVLFTTEDTLDDMLLMEDQQGRIIYDTIDKLTTALRVTNIVTVPRMEGRTRTSSTDTLSLMGIIVNLADYTVGADKGGEVNLFDDFDIDFNAQKYLIETRCSGALTVPHSAIVIESKTATA